MIGLEAQAEGPRFEHEILDREASEQRGGDEAGPAEAREGERGGDACGEKDEADEEEDDAEAGLDADDRAALGERRAEGGLRVAEEPEVADEALAEQRGGDDEGEAAEVTTALQQAVALESLAAAQVAEALELADQVRAMTYRLATR